MIIIDEIKKVQEAFSPPLTLEDAVSKVNEMTGEHVQFASPLRQKLLIESYLYQLMRMRNSRI